MKQPKIGEPFGSASVPEGRYKAHDEPKMSRHSQLRLLLRGTIVNRTYGIHKNLYIQHFLLTIVGPINYGPP